MEEGLEGEGEYWAPQDGWGEALRVEGVQMEGGQKMDLQRKIHHMPIVHAHLDSCQLTQHCMDCVQSKDPCFYRLGEGVALELWDQLEEAEVVG